MAKKKVCAVYMHEDELSAIQNVASDFETTDSYLLGDIEENDIQHLRNKGIPVRVIEEVQERKLTPGLAMSGLRNFSLGSRPAKLDLKEDNFDPTRPNVFLIKVDGPLLEKRRMDLSSMNIRLLEHIPDNNYTAFLTIEQVGDVRKLDYVQSVALYSNTDTSTTTASETFDFQSSPGSRQVKAIDVRLHRDEDSATVEGWLKDKNVLIAGAGKKKIRFYALEDSPIIEEVSSLPEVASVEEFKKPKLFNDVARRLMQIDAVNGTAVIKNIIQEGMGQIVAVADTGIDDTHPDFTGRIIGQIGLGRPGDTSDPNGHGTHVSGSILGDGSASNGAIKGVAPKASLYFQSLLDANGELGGLPINLADLFDDAYKAGARIHNNSWGADTGSTYTFNSIEVDDYVAQHNDMLIVIAAGNAGTSADPNKQLLNKPKSRLADKGFVDWLTIGSPATSKNALTVGASRSDRTSGGYSTRKYGSGWPTTFPKVTPAVTDDICDQTVSGDPERIAAFSSRGPCDDRRIKPDLVAPGTDIVSTLSSSAPAHHFWGPYHAFGTSYAYMGGTSMATPLVAGCAALVREYYVADRNHQPSAALLKATLINGAKRLTGPDALATQSFYHQGFGLVNMAKTLPNPSLPNLQLQFEDTASSPALQFHSTGQRFRFVVQLNGGSFLRVCMAYTDAPGRGLQNNLNLLVDWQDPVTRQRTKWIGNDDVNNGLNLPDPDNNVERVWIEGEDFKTGVYTIMIYASNLLKTPQDFALVVTADAPFSLVSI